MWTDHFRIWPVYVLGVLGVVGVTPGAVALGVPGRRLADKLSLAINLSLKKRRSITFLVEIRRLLIGISLLL